MWIRLSDLQSPVWLMQSRYKKIPKTPSAINILPYSLQRNISSYANLPYSERADLRREDIV
jgi:hypothetical protein